MNNQLNIDNQFLKGELDELQKNYDLLYQDVQKIYLSCPNEGPCKGHFPQMSWYCNNVGDEIIVYDYASHICVCNNSCEMTATEITV
jgi:hypothetical protein